MRPIPSSPWLFKKDITELSVLIRAALSGLALTPSRNSIEQILSWNHFGFSVWAGSVIEAHDKESRLFLAKYIDKPPLSYNQVVNKNQEVLFTLWASLIKRIYEIDPLVCAKCGSELVLKKFLFSEAEIRGIIKQDEVRRQNKSRAPPVIVY